MGPQDLHPEIKEIHNESTERCKTSSSYRSLLEGAVDFIKVPPRDGSHIRPGVIELHGKANYLFLGDLHGDYYTLLGVLNSLWEDIRNGYIVVFLGDYIDRGYMQVETLALVLSLKEKLADQVAILRGNHEPPRFLIPHPHDFPKYLSDKFGESARGLYDLSLEVFNSMPLSAIQEELFIAVHGGPPLRVLRSRDWREAFEVGKEEFTRDTLEEIMWSDPIEININYAPSPRGAGVVYGRPLSERALQLVRGRIIIRGHEAVNGFSFSHGGLVVTVFTSPIVYGLECAGVLKLEYSSELGRHNVKTLCIRVTRLAGT